MRAVDAAAHRFGDAQQDLRLNGTRLECHGARGVNIGFGARKQDPQAHPGTPERDTKRLENPGIGRRNGAQ